MSQTKTRRAALSSTQILLDEINTLINKSEDIPSYTKKTFTIGSLLALGQQAYFDTQPRAYQREKVASITWKQDLISTVFTNGFYTIPEIHIRANRTKSNGFRNKAKAITTRLEMIDGQQRWTSIVDYVNGQFPSKQDQPEMVIDGVSYEIANKFYSELPDEVKNKFLEFPIYSTIYAAITDDDTANLFVEVLNNTNDLNEQEKRNAMRGLLPKGIRNIARDFNKTNPDMHKAFEYTYGKDGRKILQHFNSNFKTGRMEADEYCAELLYLLVIATNWTDGVSQTNLTNWYKTSIRRYTTKDEWNEVCKKLQDALDDLYRILTSFPTNQKAMEKRSRLITLVMVLYYQELKTKYGQIDHESFVDAFLRVYKKWSSTSDQIYHGKLEWQRVVRQYGSADLADKYYNRKLHVFKGTGDFYSIDQTGQDILERFENILSGHQAYPKKTAWGSEDRDLGPFFNLFGGKNKNALTTIREILEYERMMGNNEDWGISERDPIRDFTDTQKDIVYDRQGGNDYYDGKPLDRAVAIADHVIPWSWGTEKGGVTTLDNCAITSKAHNKAKGNMSGSQYKRDILLDPNAAEDYFSR